MHNRRRFLKNIAGALVASAIPKPITALSNITERPKVEVTFYEKAMQRQSKRIAEQMEKIIWSGNHIPQNK